MVEHQNLEPLTMKDCVSLTRLISTILDVSDPISHAYSLKWGHQIDRPLVKNRIFSGLRIKTFGWKHTIENLKDGREKFWC
ncbi:MAG: hypothetical protein IPP67_04135 [Rhodospirillaceae bacterium]|nr:hypothetical protein [Rhodospirillaceae bacterium]